MKSSPSRIASRLLLAAAALPLTPLLAQDAQAPADAEAPATAPPADEAPAADAPAPRVVTVAPPAPAADAEEAPAEEAAPTPRRRAAAPPAARAPARAAPVRAPAPVAPAAAPVAAAPAPVPLPATPPTALPEPVADAGAVTPPPPPTADPVPATEQDSGEDNGPLFLLAGLALAGAVAAFLLSRRKRRRVEEQRYVPYEAPAAAPVPVAPVPVPQPVHTPVAAPVAAAPIAPAPVAPAPVAPAPIAAAPLAPAAVEPAGRPWLELLMRPVRAGVAEDAARVEFELRVDNRGTEAASEVRISTFMLAAGDQEASEAGRAATDRPAEAQLPEAIAPGDGRRIAATVSLPRTGLHDSILPVVVADARYRLPDGSEGRTSASFAVGVPWHGELAHFDVDNPSGLHEGVEARLRGHQEQV